MLDFMEFNFNIMIEDDSAKEVTSSSTLTAFQIGTALIHVKRELLETANAQQPLFSAELQKLREFNEKKVAKQARLKEKEIEESGVDPSQSKKEEYKNQPTGPIIDQDGFEVITDKKGRRK